jgi:hypothetical protein
MIRTHEKQEIVLELHNAALKARLDRDALLARIDPAFVASLPRAASTAEQLLTDIDTLCQVGTLVDGSVPLQRWLENAERLAGLREEATIFSRVLKAVASSRAATSTRPDNDQVDDESPGDGAITILFLGANPAGTTKLALDREVREIDERLRSSEWRDVFRVEHAWAVRATDLLERLLRYRPTIVHFSGHGNSAGELALEDETGEVKPLSATILAALFRVLGRTVRCVVLNACYSESQAQAIAEHIDFVVGMNTAIEDNAAVVFAGTFYQALGYGEDMQTAFDLGCVQIDLEGRMQSHVPKLVVTRAGVRASETKFVTTRRTRPR